MDQMELKSWKLNWEGEVPHQTPSVWPTTAERRLLESCLQRGEGSDGCAEHTVSGQAELDDDEQRQHGVRNGEEAEGTESHCSCFAIVQVLCVSWRRCDRQVGYWVGAKLYIPMEAKESCRKGFRAGVGAH